MEDVTYWKKRALEAEARAEKLRRENSDLRQVFGKKIPTAEVTPAEPGTLSTQATPNAGLAATAPTAPPRSPSRPNNNSPRVSPLNHSRNESLPSPLTAPSSPTSPTSPSSPPQVVGRAFRFLLLGAPGVGRTSLIGRFSADQRLDGVIIHSEHDEVSPLVGISDHVVQIFSPRVSTSLMNSYNDPFFRAKFEGISVAIIVYDTTDRATFKDVFSSFETQNHPLLKSNIPVVIAGNKCDIDDDRDVDAEKVRVWATKKGFGFMETSALSGKCVHEVLWHALQKALAMAAEVPPIRPLVHRISGIPTFSLIASYLAAKERIQKVSIMIDRTHVPGELWFPFGRECESKIDDILREMRQADLSLEDGALKGVSLNSLIDTAVNESTGHIVDVKVLFASLRIVGKDVMDILKLFVDKFRASNDLNERLQCLSVFKTWIQEYRVETKTKEIDRFLVTFLRGLLSLQPEISDEVHRILRMVDRRLRPTKGLQSLTMVNPNGIKIPRVDLKKSGNSISLPTSPTTSRPNSPKSSPATSPTSTPMTSPIPSPRSDTFSPHSDLRSPMSASSTGSMRNISFSPRSTSSSPMASPRGVTVTSPRYGHPLLDFINIDLARQISEIDREMFHKLTILELTSFKWNKPTDAPNPVSDITTRFNNLSNWVATLIVSTESQKLRVKIVKKLWKVAKCLRELGDFHSLMALVAGINRGPCQRLKKTMEAISSHRVYNAIQVELTALCDAKSRFASLRAAMASYVGAYIPYLGLTLSDLVISDEGNPDRVDNLINWAKCVLIFSKASQLMGAIDGYPAANVVPEMRALLSDLKHVDDNSLYDIADYMESKRRSRTGSTPPLVAPETLANITKSVNPYSVSSEQPKGSPRSVATIFTHTSSNGRSRALSSGSLNIQKSRSFSQSDVGVSHISRPGSTSPVNIPRTHPIEVHAAANTDENRDKKRLSTSTPKY